VEIHRWRVMEKLQVDLAVGIHELIGVSRGLPSWQSRVSALSLMK
jgi:hypothetical protein